MPSSDDMERRRMKEKKWSLRQALDRQTRAIGGSALRRILNWWRRK